MIGRLRRRAQAAEPAQRPYTPAEVMEKVLAVPDSMRTFIGPVKDAVEICGIPPELLEELLDLGLPCRGVGADMRFDPKDLQNISVHLRLPSFQGHMLMSWRQTLEFASRTASARFALEYESKCYRCVGRTRSFSLLVPPGERVMSAQGRHAVTVERPTVWPELPPEVAEVADRISELWFFALPEGLRTDVGFAREHGVAGCSVAAQVTLEESRSMDIEVRWCFGLLLSAPLASPHAWTDVRVDGTWVPFDPQMRHTMVQVVGLDPREWPVTRSPGAILAPLGLEPSDLSQHKGHEAHATVTTRLLVDERER